MYDLPAFKSRQPNERGSELLQLLLAEKAAPALKAELHAGSKTLGITLTATRPILEICEDITCTLQVAPAVDLLQFYCTSLIGKITLQKFQVAEQQWIIRNMARVLGVAEKQEHNPRFLSLRRTIVDACPYLLEVCCLPLSATIRTHGRHRSSKTRQYRKQNLSQHLAFWFKHAMRYGLVFRC